MSRRSYVLRETNKVEELIDQTTALAPTWTARELRWLRWASRKLIAFYTKLQPELTNGATGRRRHALERLKRFSDKLAQVAMVRLGVDDVRAEWLSLEACMPHFYARVNDIKQLCKPQ